jgi:hypothetical protein
MSDSARRSSQAARIAAMVATAVGLSLLAAACGGSPGSHVAQVATTSTDPASTSGPPSPGGPTTSEPLASQMLAFSHCMRSHGVANFPDPDSSGVWSKSQVELAAGNRRFQTATHACGYLLPDGGPGVPPSTAVVQQEWSEFRSFARCMRRHGFPNWPDPQPRSATDPRPNFDIQPVNPQSPINPASPQIKSKLPACSSLLKTANPNRR